MTDETGTYSRNEDGELKTEAAVPAPAEAPAVETEVADDSDDETDERSQEEIDSDNEQHAADWADALSAEQVVAVAVFLGSLDPVSIQDNDDLRDAVISARDAKNEMTGV